jgi:hypothetical protein
MRLLLSTTAVLMLATAPAFAQVSPYDTNPTPNERTQTNQLNQNADEDAQAPVAPSTSDADYAAKKADYDRKMQEYNARHDAYEHERDRYRADRADYVHRWDAFYGYRDFRDVDTMSGSGLIGLRVSARGGDGIGRIRNVDRNPEGRVIRVAVSTGGGTIAWIDADDLRFDPVNREVMTDLSRREVDSMAHPRF